MAKIAGKIQSGLMTVIRCYQWVISPLLGECCRFYPSCSSYAIEAIRQHGVINGITLMVCRVCRCHPWHEGGHDPVPLGKEKKWLKR